MAHPAFAEHPSFDEDLRVIRRKRALLDKLIAFARQLHRLAGSFDILKEMVKPSQRANQKYLRVLYGAMQECESKEIAPLQQELRSIDQRVQQQLQGIIALSMMREESFSKLFETQSGSESCYTKIHGELKSFEELLQRNLAIRYVLDKRGAMLQSCRLPISQEDIQDHADRLKKEESACKNRVQRKLKDLLEDTKRLLSNPALPQDLRDRMNTVQSNLQNKLDALNTDDMDAAMSSLQNFDLDAATGEAPPPAQPAASEAKNAARSHAERHHVATSKSTPSTPASTETQPSTKTHKKPSGIKAFIRWLNTPWGVSYDEIKRKNNKDGEN